MYTHTHTHTHTAFGQLTRKAQPAELITNKLFITSLTEYWRPFLQCRHGDSWTAEPNSWSMWLSNVVNTDVCAIITGSIVMLLMLQLQLCQQTDLSILRRVLTIAFD